MKQLLKGDTKDIWTKRTSNDFGRLAKGNKHVVRSTDTKYFIREQDTQKNRKVTYARFACDYRTIKSEPHRVRLVVVGDKIIYED